jgi:nicotinate phosphoribosyltransferase
MFNEFGTRRRRSFKTQDIVVREMSEASRTWKGEGKMVGTSNVRFSYLCRAPHLPDSL